MSLDQKSNWEEKQYKMDSKASEPSDSLVGTQSQIENVHSRGGKGAGDNDLEKDTTVTIDQDQESNVTDEGPQKWNFKAVVAMISLSMTFVGSWMPCLSWTLSLGPSLCLSHTHRIANT